MFNPVKLQNLSIKVSILVFFSLFCFYTCLDLSKNKKTEFLRSEDSKFFWDFDLREKTLNYDPGEFYSGFIHHSHSETNHWHILTFSLIHSDLLVFPIMEKRFKAGFREDVEKKYQELIQEFKNKFPVLSALNIIKGNENQNISIEFPGERKESNEIILTEYQNQGKQILNKFLVDEKWIIPTNRNWNNSPSFVFAVIGLVILTVFFLKFKGRLKNSRKLAEILVYGTVYSIFSFAFFYAAYEYYQSSGFYIIELKDESFSFSISKAKEGSSDPETILLKDIHSLSFLVQDYQIQIETDRKRDIFKLFNKIKYPDLHWDLKRTGLSARERVLAAHFLCAEIQKRRRKAYLVK